MRVYAVWFNMILTDQRSEWPEKLLTDGRVTHFWDEQKLLGKWYATQKEYSRGPNDVVWDAFFVYGRNSSWADKPSDLIGWGRPIISNKDRLSESLAAALKVNP